MIYKGYYTMTIDEYCELKERPKAILRMNIWWPEKWIKQAIEQLNKEIALKVNKKLIENERFDNTQLLHIETKINLLIVMYRSFLLAWVIKPRKEMIDLFEKHFGGTFAPERIEEIPDMLKKLKTARKEELEKHKQDQPHETDFTMLVNRIGELIGFPIGKEKLFRLNGYIQRANEIIKSKEK